MGDTAPLLCRGIWKTSQWLLSKHLLWCMILWDRITDVKETYYIITSIYIWDRVIFPQQRMHWVSHTFAKQRMRKFTIHLLSNNLPNLVGKALSWEFIEKCKKKQGVKTDLYAYFKKPMQIFMLCFQGCFQQPFNCITCIKISVYNICIYVM